VEATIWTERMVSALENGVKGGKWFSLIDEVYGSLTATLRFETARSSRARAGQA
jgi:RNA-directed DNA polymerase